MPEMTPDCPHGEYTLVTGAQTSVLALQITVFGVKCTKCGKQWDMGDMMTAPARLEALEKERVAYLKALCQEDSYVIERVTRRVINMRDETTPELAEGLAALAAKEEKP